MFRILLQSPDPIFQQLVDQVKSAVSQGRLNAGDKLPSVREMAHLVAVNPNTVVKAFDILERDGVILRRRGAGTFLTGKTTNLAPTERRKKLASALGQAISEARLLDFSPAEITKAFERELSKQAKPTPRN